MSRKRKAVRNAGFNVVDAEPRTLDTVDRKRTDFITYMRKKKRVAPIFNV